MQKVNWYEGSLQIVSRNMLAHSPELSHWSCFSTRMLFNRQISLNEHENQRHLEKEKTSHRRQRAENMQRSESLPVPIVLDDGVAVVF